MSEENIQWNKVTPPNDSWDFEEQPIMQGIYEKVENNVGRNNSNVYTFKLEDDKLTKVWGSTGLDERMAMLKVGDLVRIEFKGKSDLGGGKTFKNYDVFLGEL